MRRALAAVLIVLGVSVPYAQDTPDPFDPAVAVPKAWVILTSALDTGALQDQLAAVSALTAAGTPRALEVFERVAREGSPPVRSTAIWYLPVENRSKYLPIVADALKDPDLNVRRKAIHRLGSIRDPRTLPLLQNVIMSGDVDTIEYAVGSARLLGSPAFGMLLEALDRGGEGTRGPVIRTIDVLVSAGNSSTAADNLETLRRLRPERILIKALDASDSLVRVLAALILARLGDNAGVDELVRASTLADPKFGTIVSRHYAMAALHALGRPGYLAPLAAALEHPEQRVRLDAALAMRSFAHPSMYDIWNATWRGTLPMDVRYWAFHGLVALRGADLGMLRAGLVDREPSIRLRAAEALLALGPDAAAVDALERLAADAEPRTRSLAQGFLSTKGDPRRTAVVARSLLPKAEDLARMRSGHVYDPEYRLSVVHTLGVVQDREAVPALGALFGPDWTLNSYVSRALVAIGDDLARRTLVRAMDSPHSTARIHAAGGVISIYEH